MTVLFTKLLNPIFTILYLLTEVWICYLYTNNTLVSRGLRTLGLRVASKEGMF